MPIPGGFTESYNGWINRRIRWMPLAAKWYWRRCENDADNNNGTCWLPTSARITCIWWSKERLGLRGL